MKHVVTRPFITSILARLSASYARQPLLQPLILPNACSLILAILTFLVANGGGPLFVLGALGVVICSIWAGMCGAQRLMAFIQDVLRPQNHTD